MNTGPFHVEGARHALPCIAARAKVPVACGQVATPAPAWRPVASLVRVRHCPAAPAEALLAGRHVAHRAAVHEDTARVAADRGAAEASQRPR
eukprot:scaffold87447_cov67-Phaeocystis_antarctica.AAC.5